jgi:hypothetical protein
VISDPVAQAERRQIGIVDAGQHGHAEQLRATLALARGVGRGAQHRRTAAHVHGQHRDAEPRCLTYRAGHRVGDVVELDVEQGRQAEVDHAAHAVGAVRGHELEPDLQAADRADQRAAERQGAVEVGPVDGAKHRRAECHEAPRKCASSRCGADRGLIPAAPRP